MLATETASGKSLAYTVPANSAPKSATDGGRRPTADELNALAKDVLDRQVLTDGGA